MCSSTEILHNSFVVKKAYDTLWDEIGTTYGMTRAEIDVLAFIANNPELNTARDIVNYRLIAKSHVSKATDSLIERGFIQGEQDSGDRRKIRLILTESAAEIIGKIRERQAVFACRLIDGLTEEDMAVLDKITSRITENAQKMLDE